MIVCVLFDMTTPPRWREKVMVYYIIIKFEERLNIYFVLFYCSISIEILLTISLNSFSD